MWIPNVGAYGLSASLLAFLSHDPPVELVVSETGEVHPSRLVVERRPAQPDAAGILRSVGEDGGLAALSGRFREQSTDMLAMKLYDVSCWELTRSRSCHLRWLRLQSMADSRIPADVVDRFEGEVVIPWQRALQFAHLGFKRVESGAPPPMVSFDLVATTIPAAEVSVAQEMLDRIAGP